MLNRRAETIETINRLAISKIDLAAIACVQPPRVADYLHGRPVPPDKAARIEKATADIARVWGLMYPYRLDTKDADVFRQAITEVDAALSSLAAAKVFDESIRNTDEGIREAGS